MLCVDTATTWFTINIQIIETEIVQPHMCVRGLQRLMKVKKILIRVFDEWMMRGDVAAVQNKRPQENMTN